MSTRNRDTDDLLEKGLIYFNGTVDVPFDLKKAREYFLKSFENGNIEAGFKLLTLESYIDVSAYYEHNELFYRLKKLLKKEKNYLGLSRLYKDNSPSGIRGFFISEKRWIKYWKKAKKNKEPVFKEKIYGDPERQISKYYYKLFDNTREYLSYGDEYAYKYFFNNFASDLNTSLGDDVESRRQEIIRITDQAKYKFSSESWVYYLSFGFLYNILKYFEKVPTDYFGRPQIEKEKYDFELISAAKNDLEKAIQIDNYPSAHWALFKLYSWSYESGYNLSTGNFEELTEDMGEEYIKKADEHLFEFALGSSDIDAFREFLMYSNYSPNDAQIEKLIRKYSCAYNNFRKGSSYEYCLREIKLRWEDVWNQVQLKLRNDEGQKFDVRDPILVGKLYCEKCHSYLEYYDEEHCFRCEIGCAMFHRKVTINELKRKFIDSLNILIKDKDNIINDLQTKINAIPSDEEKDNKILEYNNFIAELKKLDSEINEWSDELWLKMVDYIIVNGNSKLTFVFRGKTTIDISIYEQLTKYISLIDISKIGDWEGINNDSSKGYSDIPYVKYEEVVYKFIQDIVSFCENHSEYNCNNYKKLLEAANVNIDSLSVEDIMNYDDKIIILILFAIIRAERFCEGVLLVNLKNGTISKLLKRLEEFEK